MNYSINRALHDKLFVFLKNKHKLSNMPFRLRRTNRYDRLKEGFWFHGTEKYLALSFWAGSDWKNKTPNIAFIFKEDGSVFLLLTGKDSKEKTEFFQQEFFQKNEGFEIDTKHSNFDGSISFEETNFFKKLKYTWNHSNIKDVVGDIITKEKRKIDLKIKKLISKKDYSTESNSINFIDEFDFKKILNNTLKYQVSFKQILKETQISLAGTTRSDYAVLIEKVQKTLHELPIRLNSIEIKDYKNLKNISKISIPKNKQWIFILGENGSGKSSFLEALALSMKGNYDGDRVINTQGANLKAQFSCNDETKSNSIVDKKLNPKFTEINEFICYGANRFEKVGFKSNSGVLSKTMSLFEPEAVANLLNIETALINWELKSKIAELEKKTETKKLSTKNIASNRESYYSDLIKNLKEIFLGTEEEKLNKGLLPELVDFKVVKSEIEDKVVYILGDENKTELDFNKLSTGNKSLISMIGDLIIRFIKYHSSDAFPDPSNFSGIVLIDEIDAHIHPKWQWQITNILSEMFPNIQFFATCHSPIPLLGLKDPDRAIFLRSYKDEYFSSKIESFEIDIKRLTPNSILTSPLFDFRNILSAGFDEKIGFTSKIDYEEEVFNKVLKRKVNEINFYEKN